MQNIENILVVIQDYNDTKPALTKTKTKSLTGAVPVKVHAVRVVYEGLADLSSKHISESSDLKSFVLAAEEPLLVEAIEQAGVELANVEAATIWNRNTWEGVLHTAEATDADLIVKHSEPDDALIHLRTPDDWNLLRHSSKPVLLTKAKSWPAKPVVVAALDVYDQHHDALNQRVLRTAHQVCQALSGALHIVSVFPMLSNWMDNVTTIESYHHLKQEIEEEITDNVLRLCQNAGIKTYEVHALEGLTEVAINDLLVAVKADMVVIGTKARTGVTGYLMGNTAEKILHRAAVDVLTVP